MSKLSKMKKDELIALAEANDLSVDPDWNKKELVAELEAEGVEPETVVSEATAGESKAERHARLAARSPDEIPERHDKHAPK